MPKDNKKINESFKQIVEKYKKNPLPDGANLEDKFNVYNEILQEMSSKLKMLNAKKEITPQQNEYAKNALEFYQKNVKMLPFQAQPSQILGEIPGIDFNKEVKIVKLKKDRLLTQMQAPDSKSHGNFFAESVLPSDYEERAERSGIGSKSLKDRVQETKSVYIAKTSGQMVALKSSAEPIYDTWSDPEKAQFAKGGGAQLRIETEGHAKVAFLAWGEFEANKAPSVDKAMYKQKHQTIKNTKPTPVITNKAKKKNSEIIR